MAFCSAAFVSATPSSLRSTSFARSSKSSLCHRAPPALLPPSASRARMTATSAPPTPVAAEPDKVQVVSVPPAQKPPAGAFDAAVNAGAMKGQMPAARVFLLGVLAGAYIALGGFLALRVGGAVGGLVAANNAGLQRLLLGLFGLPTGLLLVLATGGELFTGNTMLLSAAVMSGRTSITGLLRNWVFSFVGNFVGSLLVVKLVMLSGLGGSVAAAAGGVAIAKTAAPFAQMFWRGVICNWLVCLAVYTANAASDLASKFVAVVLPVSMFVAMGMEHSIANMFFVPMGIATGAAVSAKTFLSANLLPVTLGNIFAGVVMVALAYFLAFGKKK